MGIFVAWSISLYRVYKVVGPYEFSAGIKKWENTVKKTVHAEQSKLTNTDIIDNDSLNLQSLSNNTQAINFQNNTIASNDL